MLSPMGSRRSRASTCALPEPSLATMATEAPTADEKNVKKAERILQEIVETERGYVAKLMVLNDVRLTHCHWHGPPMAKDRPPERGRWAPRNVSSV